jgi:pimeloyl-ACP methyl ester carboxylesterase
MAGNAPSLRLWAAETLEVPKLLLSPLQRAVPIPHGQGQPVLVYPGYLTGDVSSIRLRRSLRASGYAAYGWGLGQNKGARADLLDRLGARLDSIVSRHGQPAALVGWSLGGIFARELAKQRPDLIQLVITLGSPFSGSPRDNNAWRIYELLNDHPVDRPPIDAVLQQKPPVRTIAVHSPIDGIVAQRSARGLPDESDRQVEIAERHLSLARSPAAIRLIGQLLSEEL